MKWKEKKEYIRTWSEEEYNEYLKYCRKISNAKYNEKNKEILNPLKKEYKTRVRKEDVERQKELNRKHQRDYRNRMKKL